MPPTPIRTCNSPGPIRARVKCIHRYTCSFNFLQEYVGIDFGARNLPKRDMFYDNNNLSFNMK